MCLSNVYKDEINKDNLLMKNVSNIRIDGTYIELVDIMENKRKIKASLEKVDLIENYIVVKLLEDDDGK